MVIAFEKQMTLLWSRVFKLIRELIGKKIGGAALNSFIDFMVEINLPISLIVLPLLQTKVSFLFSFVPFNSLINYVELHRFH